MRFAILCFVFFIGFAVGQFDQQRIALSDISLTNTVSVTRHVELQGSALANSIANNECRNYFHTIRNVQTNNGPQNSGSYYTVTFSNVIGGTLSFSFGLPNQGSSFSTVTIGPETCGSTCTFEYLCENYADSSTLEINLFAQDVNSAIEVVSYDVSVTQYVETVSTISNTRTLSQTTPVSGNSGAANNIGPENFVHYYHDLVLSTAEQAESSTMYVIIDNYVLNAGSGSVCVSFSNLVSSNDNLPGTVNTFDVDGNPLGFNLNNNLNSPAGNSDCPPLCGQGVLSAGSFYVGFDSDDICGFGNGDMWIGVRLPAADTFDVTISFDQARLPVTVPVLGQSNELVGRLSDSCDLTDGDFSCDDYYLISSSNINFSVNDPRLGPILDIELFGAQNGDFTGELSRNLGGSSASACSATLDTCSISNTGASRYCEIIVCDVDITSDYILTVSQDNGDTSVYTSDYGVAINVLSWPLEVVDISQPRTYFGSVAPNHYEHYEISITNNDIFTDSYFFAEMYPANPIDDQISFAWNFNALAGSPLSCYSNIETCSTNTDCGDYDYFDLGNTAKTFCRFSFVPCSIFGDNELQVGTYYFAVWGSNANAQSNNQYPNIEYTLNFNMMRSVVLSDLLPTIGSVYNFETSPQYQISIPEDPSITDIVITIDNVKNGIATFRANCGAPAGQCPCYESIASCSVQSPVPYYPGNYGYGYFPFSSNYYDNYRCDLVFTRCSCLSNTIYISAESDSGFVDDTSTHYYNVDSERPIFFTLIVDFHTIKDFDVIDEVAASRIGSTVTDFVTFEPVFNENYYYNNAADESEQSRFFKIATNQGVLIGDNDSLSITLNAAQIPTLFRYDNDYYQTVDVFPPTLGLAVSRNTVPNLLRFGGDCDTSICVINLNQYYYYETKYMSTCSLSFNQCNNGCGKETTFEPESFYYAEVKGFNSYFTYNGFSNQVDLGVYQDIQFSLHAQIIDNSPKALTDGLIVYGNVMDDQYFHFSFDVSATIANSKLNIEVYRDDKDQTPLVVDLNYWNGQGSPVLAGEAEDCFGSILCDGPCILDGTNQNHCGFSIPPCELSSQLGTYYVSVQSENDLFYFYSASGPYSSSYHANTMNTNDGSDFTITAYTETMTEILPLGLPTPIIGDLFTGENAYYSLTYPGTPGGLAGRVLRMTFTNYDSNLDVYLSTETPDLICGSCLSTTPVAPLTDIHFRRTPCERQSDIYYIFVDGSRADDCDRADFSITAHTEDISLTNVALSSVTNGRVNAEYDSTLSLNSDENSLIVSSGEFRVVSFSVSAAAGEHFSIQLTMDSIISNPNIDVFVSTDNFFIPPTGADDFGPVDGSSCTTPVATCTGLSSNNECRIHFDPCEIDASTNYFITLSGANLPVKAASGIVNIFLKKYSSPSVINVPLASAASPATATTTLAFSEAITQFQFYSFQTNGNLGLSGGEELEFSISSSVSSFEVSIGNEVGGGCPSTCSDAGGAGQRTCTVYACDAISSSNWFFYMNAIDAVSVTLTITRTSGSPSPININTIPLNTQVSFGPFTGSNAFDGEFQYFTFSVPASDPFNPATTAAYFLESTANPANFFTVTTPTFIPGVTFVGNDVALFSDFSTSNTCGGDPFIAFPSNDCCFDANTWTFAIRNVNSAQTLEVRSRNFLGVSQNIAVGATPTVGTISASDLVDMYTFTVNPGNDVYFEFAATSGSNLRIYLNRDNVAGSAAARGNIPPADITARNAGYCWGNDNNVGFGTICSTPLSGTQSCSAVLPTCAGCSGDSSSSLTYTFAVTGDAASTYTLEVQLNPTERQINVGLNGNLPFPLNSQIIDDSTDGQSNSLWSNYVFSYSDIPQNNVNFIPSNEFPAADYPNLHFTISNFRDSVGAVVNNPFTIFISDSPAGNNLDCLTGTDINQGRTLYPCLENAGGGATSTVTSVDCSIAVCDLGCNNDIYFGFAKDVADFETYTFDIQVTQDFTELTDSGTVEILNLAANSATNTVTRPLADNNAVVFVRTTSAGIGPGQFARYTFTPNVDVAASVTLDFDSVDSPTCDSGTSLTPCGNTVSFPDSCVFLSDPCDSQNIDPNFPQYYRIARSTGTGAWGFTLEIDIITITRIDQTLTSLSSQQSSYSATKEITDLSWQFYAFTISENDGYSWLDVTLDNVHCEGNGDNLEVYTSWGSAVNAFSDVNLPNKWPSASCNLSDDTDFGTFSSFEIDTCQFSAGTYRVSVFADNDIQIFPDDSLTTLTGPVPITYDISATLSSMDFVTVSGCVAMTSGDDLIPRMEIPIEAFNRGSRLVFTASGDADGTFHISRNSFAWGRGSLTACQFDDDNDNGVDSCFFNAGSSCQITINECEFIDGKYFGFLEDAAFTAGDEFSLSWNIIRSYIPVIDSVANSGDIYSGRLYLAEDSTISEAIQYYQIAADTGLAFITTLRSGTDLCEDLDCAITIELFSGSRGHGFSNGDTPFNDFCEDCSTSIASCTIFDDDDDCTFFTNCPEVSNYYIGLFTDDDDEENCFFELTVERVGANGGTILVEDEVVCVKEAEDNLFGIINTPSSSKTVISTQINDGIGSFYYSVGGHNCYTMFTGTITLDGCDVDPGESIFVLFVPSDDDCDTEITISYSNIPETVVSLSSGVPGGVGDFATFTTQGNFMIGDVDMSISATANVPGASCLSVCSNVLAPNTQYFISPSTVTLSPISLVQLTTTASSVISFDKNTDIAYFTVPITSGTTGVKFWVESVTFSTFDFDNTGNANLDDVNIAYATNFDAPPSFGCGIGCGNFISLATNGCANDYAPFTVVVDPTCDNVSGNLFISFAICNSITCGVSFTVRAEVEANANTSIFTGAGTHNSGFVTASAVGTPDCSFTGTSDEIIFVDVTDILSVSLRNPQGGDASVNVNGCGFGNNCGVTATDFCIGSTCNTNMAVGCVTDYCVPEGTYEVSVSPAAGPSSVEYQIVNSWVDLSTFVQTTIYGQTAHFYRLTNAGSSSLTIDFDIQSGPSLAFTVFSGCDGDAGDWSERQICGFGTCSTYVPTQGKQNRKPNKYIVVESNTFGVHSPPESEVNQVKPTAYSINVISGTSNCASPPTTGFCANADQAGVNVWASLSNGLVWSYDDTQGKDSEAQCLYNNLIDRCPSPTVECKEFLKVFACLETFPQCNPNGYQMGTCRDVCTQVESVCGQFIDVEYDDDENFFLYDCASARYQPNSSGSCYTDLPVTVVPTPVDPLSFFNDDGDDGTYGLPGTINVPYFPPQYATIPSIRNDDDDGVGNVKDLIVEDNTSEELILAPIADSSSSSTLLVSFVVMAFCFMLF